MKTFVKALLGLTCILTLVCTSTGCGQSEPAVSGNTAPFKKAIEQYCRNKSMGMKVKEFVTLKTEDNAATATAKMVEAGGNYGISVKWKFKFKKENGKWKVLSHDS
ncbi:hypothetical protein P0136_08790 [Lentisphaerota bacterium ZTH]|nr:hypothetical protein JYG24_00105 [Lentisphaerota bacterium]WET05460.1 hypothetical protein P0136_08790 [Lentisphaerota bacterium ZTH]